MQQIQVLTDRPVVQYPQWSPHLSRQMAHGLAKQGHCQYSVLIYFFH